MPPWLAAAAVSAALSGAVVAFPDNRDPNYHGPHSRPAPAVTAPPLIRHGHSKSHRAHAVRRVAK